MQHAFASPKPPRIIVAFTCKSSHAKEASFVQVKVWGSDEGIIRTVFRKSLENETPSAWKK